jgi:hypothetical protein
VTRISAYSTAVCLVGLLAATPAEAQSSPPDLRGLNGAIFKAVGVIAGLVGVAAGMTLREIHNQGIVVGCVADSGATKTVLDSDGVTYSLLEPGPSAPVGRRVKLKGHRSGPSSARSFRVEMVVKDYGQCQP